MKIVEEALTFDCDGQTLVGVVAMPDGSDGTARIETAAESAVHIETAAESAVHIETAAESAAAGTAVVVVVGGPQYRAGSHRQFVHLARSLAACGHPVLRFDYRGMGDSSGEPTDFRDAGPDVAAAVGALRARLPDVERIVLWGLCDGASAALLSLSTLQGAALQGSTTQCAVIDGLVLLNPWVRSEASLARTHVRHYYLQRLRQPAFWRKLLGGGVAVQAVRELGRNLGSAIAGARPAADDEAPFQQRMAAALAGFDGAVALFLSGNDYTAREFSDHAAADPVWRSTLDSGRVTRVDFEAADHTFSDHAARLQVEAETLRWLARFAPAAPAQPAAPLAAPPSPAFAATP